MSSLGVERLRQFMLNASDLAGGLTNVAFSYLTGAGPGAQLAGTAAGQVVKYTLTALSEEALSRTVSKREAQRMAAELTYAAVRVQARLEAGEQPRQDGFFDRESADRSAAEEIAEGILLVAQREHQEKKLRFLGNLYASIAFTPGIDRAHADFLVRSVERLSYRQLCLMVVFMCLHAEEYAKQLALWEGSLRSEPGRSTSQAQYALFQEILELCMRDMAGRNDGTAILGIVDISPGRMRLCGGSSLLLYQLMELHTLPMEDIQALVPLLR